MSDPKLHFLLRLAPGVLATTVLAAGCGSTATTPVRPSSALQQSTAYPFQQKIVEYVMQDSIADDGRFVYYWPRADTSYKRDHVRHLGTARDIDYLGVRLSTVRDNMGTHCVGITWQVVMSVLDSWSRAIGQQGRINEMSVDEMEEFIRRWFVMLSDDRTLKPPEETGAVYALTSFDLGRSIPFREAKPGDFVQFWRRDGSGHSCIFLHWVYDANGNIIGFHYWGSQPQTDGIGTDTEYFYPNSLAPNPDRLLDRERFYIGRLAPR